MNCSRISCEAGRLLPRLAVSLMVLVADCKREKRWQVFRPHLPNRHCITTHSAPFHLTGPDQSIVTHRDMCLSPSISMTSPCYGLGPHRLRQDFWRKAVTSNSAPNSVLPIGSQNHLPCSNKRLSRVSKIIWEIIAHSVRHLQSEMYEPQRTVDSSCQLLPTRRCIAARYHAQADAA